VWCKHPWTGNRNAEILSSAQLAALQKIAAQHTEKSPKMPPATQVPTSINPQAACPCGSGIALASCCQPYIDGKANAPTAETLMRSRYTAHVLLAIDYLWDTWSPDLRIRSSKADIKAWASACEWLGLRILETNKGQPQDDEGLVHFVAVFRQHGQLEQHQELSLFRKSGERWLYIDHHDA
jgi:SEC-C motif domain protein